MQEQIEVDNSKFAQSKLNLDVIPELGVVEFTSNYDGIFYLHYTDID